MQCFYYTIVIDTYISEILAMSIEKVNMANILVVEDNESLNAVYELILEKNGHDVITAFNGLEALKILKSTTPDLILLDMLMPEMGGLGFLKRFNRSKSEKTKIIILSNLDEDQEIKEARKYGVSNYILKASVSPAELIAKVKHTLQEKNLKISKN
jgi:DNA-binding response OmpR family regulator